MFIINSDQEKYNFLNMCKLCRYVQFLQAQSQIRVIIPLLNVASNQLLHDKVASYNLELSTRRN